MLKHNNFRFYDFSHKMKSALNLKFVYEILILFNHEKIIHHYFISGTLDCLW
jgi:hypothetical protein